MKLFGVLAFLIAPLAFVTTAGATVVTIAPRAIDSGANVVAGVPRIPFRDLGPASPGRRVHLAIVLRYRNEAQLRDLADRQSKMLHGFRVLSAAQFRNYFSPTPADYGQTIFNLTRLGFSVTKTYANRTVVDVAAPAAIVNRAFGTSIHNVYQAPVRFSKTAGVAGGNHYANLTPAVLPSELRPLVYGVTGFTDLRVLKPSYQIASSRAKPLTAIGPPLQAPDTGLGPYALVNAYDFPVQHAVTGGSPGQTYDGTGEGAAVVIDSDYTESDLSSFLSYFNITRTGPPTGRVLIQGGPNPAINFDDVETTLDVETIVGTTPGVALTLYLTDSLSYASIIDAYNQIDTDDIVGAVNSSFGGCEDFTNPSYFPQLTDYLAMQGTVLGINYSASTGDNGTFACTFTAPGGVSTPASGPHFVAAGGTTLFVSPPAGKYVREFGWSGSGGGVSDVFPKPAYQKGVAHVSGKFRNLPDISYDADPGSGVAFFYHGAWQGPLGGTSLSSPLVTALVTQLNQVNGTNLGDVHPLIYGLFKSVQYGNGAGGTPIFHDVIGGNNGFYNATKKYDNVTGIGTIDGWNFAQAASL